jgi:hypothetical protein
MIRKFKNIASLILLAVFLFSSLVKLEHHHENYGSHSKNEKYYHLFHEKCAICSFEFSIFSDNHENIVIPKEQPIARYCNNYRSVHYSALSKYSFLLRAPPYRQI